MNKDYDSSDAYSVSNHQRIQFEDEVAYMATIAKRQKLFNDALHQHQYKVDDLVGLKIDKGDKLNVTSKVLPCKIISVQPTSNDMDTYQLCTTTAIIFSRFQTRDLLNLSNCNFGDLRDIDSKTLPITTFIQACNAYISAGLITPIAACNYKGTCTTKKCGCEAAKIQCDTKCYSSKKKPCSNM